MSMAKSASGTALQCSSTSRHHGTVMKLDDSASVKPFVCHKKDLKEGSLPPPDMQGGGPTAHSGTSRELHPYLNHEEFKQPDATESEDVVKAARFTSASSLGQAALPFFVPGGTAGRDFAAFEGLTNKIYGGLEKKTSMQALVIMIEEICTAKIREQVEERLNMLEGKYLMFKSAVGEKIDAIEDELQRNNEVNRQSNIIERLNLSLQDMQDSTDKLAKLLEEDEFRGTDSSLQKMARGVELGLEGYFNLLLHFWSGERDQIHAEEKQAARYLAPGGSPATSLRSTAPPIQADTQEDNRIVLASDSPMVPFVQPPELPSALHGAEMELSATAPVSPADSPPSPPTLPLTFAELARQHKRLPLFQRQRGKQAVADNNMDDMKTLITPQERQQLEEMALKVRAARETRFKTPEKEEKDCETKSISSNEFTPLSDAMRQTSCSTNDDGGMTRQSSSSNDTEEVGFGMSTPEFPTNSLKSVVAGAGAEGVDGSAPIKMVDPPRMQSRASTISASASVRSAVISRADGLTGQNAQ